MKITFSSCVCEVTHKADDTEVTWLTVVCHPVSAPTVLEKHVGIAVQIAESKVKAGAACSNFRLCLKFVFILIPIV